MLKQKKKISRKELKEDKFVLYTLKAKTFLEQNSKNILRVSIALLVLIVLVIFYVRSKESANVNASALLGQAQIAMNQGNEENAISMLTDLINRYSGTTAAGRGTFYLARLYWQNRDYENAKQYFKMYIDDYSGNPILTPAALAGYADCLSVENNYSEAAKNYEQAARANPQFPEAPSFLYSAALAYRDAGNLNKALELGQKIIKEYDNSTYKSKAELLVEMIRFENQKLS